VCNTADGTLKSEYGDHGEGLHGITTSATLAISPNGFFAASMVEALEDRSLRLWDVKREKELWTLRKRSDPNRSWLTSCLCFSGDGRMLAAFGPDKQTWIWERATAKVRLKFKGDPFLYGGGLVERFGIISGSARHLVVSHSGKLLAKVVFGVLPPKGPPSCTLKVWEVASLSLKEISPVRKSKKDSDLASLIAALPGDDAQSAYEAVLLLSKRKSAVNQLKTELKQMQSKFTTYRELIGTKVPNLDSNVFTVREKTTQELKKPAWFYPKLLQDATKKHNLSAEAEGRVSKLLDMIRPENIPEEARFMHRALEVLELASTVEARDLLREIVKNFPPEFSSEAGQSLQRSEEEK
jgi:hypothetical protein